MIYRLFNRSQIKSYTDRIVCLMRLIDSILGKPRREAHQLLHHALGTELPIDRPEMFGESEIPGSSFELISIYTDAKSDALDTLCLVGRNDIAGFHLTGTKSSTSKPTAFSLECGDTLHGPAPKLTLELKRALANDERLTVDSRWAEFMGDALCLYIRKS